MGENKEPFVSQFSFLTSPTHTQAPTRQYRRLLSYVRPYRGIFTVAVVALLVEALVQPVLPLVFQRLLDGAFAPGASSASTAALGTFAPLAWVQAWLRELPILWLPAFVVAMFVVRGLANFIGDYLMHWVGNKVVADLRVHAFDRLMKLPARFFDSQPTGTLTSKLTYDAAQVSQASSQAVISLVQDSATLIVMLLTMWHFSPRLTLLALTVAPAVAIVIRVVTKRLKKATRGIQETMGELTTAADQAIVGHRVVKNHGGQAHEVAHFSRAANRVRQFQMKEAAANDAANPVMHVFVAVAIAAVIAMAIYDGQRGALTAGGLMGFLTALLQTLSPLKKLTGVNAMIQRGLAAAESVFQVIDTPAEKDEGTHRVARARGEIRLNNVVHAYSVDKPPALNGISLHIVAGETIALVGASGSGKSSLVSLLVRLYEPTQGEITLDGVPLAQWQLASLREQIAIVSQEIVLFNESVANNIAYGSTEKASRDAITSAAQAAYAHDFISQLPQGYDSVIGERGIGLSGGQRQRLAIARAILRNAPILILDEATAALDNESERAVQTAVTALMQGRTTIVIAHRLSTIEKADRIVVLENGEIREIGTHSVLLAKGGAYSKLHAMGVAASLN
jgi:ATP-binding cassette, subfamily B, bacterial MsbA